MSTPDIQYFGSSGTWVKPERAVRVDVTVCAADADGVLGDGSCKYVLGNESEPNVRRFPAAEMPDNLAISVHLDGLDGYALIVTHLADPPLPSVPPHDRMRHAHSHEHPDDPAAYPHEHVHSGPGHMGIEHVHPHRHAPVEVSPFAANERAIDAAVRRALDDWEQK